MGQEMTQSRQTPVWQTGVLLAVLVAVAAGFAWWQWGQHLSFWNSQVTVEPAALGRVAPRGVVRSAAQLVRENVWRVRAGDAIMWVDKSKGGEGVFSFSYANTDFVSAEVRDLAVVRWRLAQDAAMAKAVGVSAEQVKQLRKIAGITGMELSEADRALLRGVWGEYQAASDTVRPAVEEKLVAALREVSQRSVEATRRTAQARAEEIKGIVTPEQLARFKQLATGGRTAGAGN